jgi:glucose-6-phosphate dehydrogenase assembly protein OpcA
MTTGHSIPADFESVRKELAKTTLSAMTMNFVVWLDNPEHREWILDAADKVTDKHPSRTIVLEASAAVKGMTLADPAHDPSDLTVHAQRVTIGCAALTPDSITESVQSLLVPGLPTVLWWTGNPFARRPTFEALAAIAENLIVNTSGTAADESMVIDLEKFMAARASMCVRDIAWMRLRSWQDMIAQFFDNPTVREELFAISKLKIVAGSDAEALYLGGWFGSRLGWRACGHDEFCDRNEKRIPFEHIRSGGLRRVRSIEITTPKSVLTATVSDSDENVITLKAEREGEPPGERLVQLQAMDNASLVERAILDSTTDEVFETALRMVGTLLT